MASKLSFDPTPDGIEVRVRDTKIDTDGFQVDGAFVAVNARAYSERIVVKVGGRGIKAVNRINGEPSDTGVLADYRLFLMALGPEIEFEVLSEKGSGPFRVTIEFDPKIEPYNDFT